MNHPEQLGKYRITGVLGEGAMGVVYRGFDPDIRRTVALKTVRQLGGQSADAVAHSAARFRNEAQAAGRLMHPGIVGVYDFGQSSDNGVPVAYIAMEYVEGHTLAPYLAQKVRFSEPDIASIATQLLDALSHAHEHGVWHRDIKPSNVILTSTGRIKIADFGIARTDNGGLTAVGSVLGTPMYMAPEQFMGRPMDHRVDVYGAGVLLYQLVAGRPPFVGPQESLMYKVVNDVPDAPSGVAGARAGAMFDAVVAQALAKDPQARFGSASAFGAAVVQALSHALHHPVPALVSADAVHAIDPPTTFAPTQRIAARQPGAPASVGSAAAHAGSGSTSQAPAHWDAATLAKVEAALARHVGPLAGVLVRRAARECHDIAALYLRLGEQITQDAARAAFLGVVSGTGGSRSGARSSGGSSGSASASHGSHATRPASGSGASPPAPVSDALLEQAQRLLASQVGPIAKVVVKRAAERTRERAPLFALLADAVPDAARAKLLADLDRLH